MKLPAVVAAVALPLLSLTACAVSAEESKACADKEGLIVTRAFKMHDKKETQSFTFCEVNGKITKFFDTADLSAPKAFTNECTEAKGEIYARESKSEKKEKNEDGEEVVTSVTKRQSFVCVADGAVVKSFYQEN